jgi:predicted RNA-binding Zn-ribbon protein involved in translation (DUF1610 family)
MAKCLSCKKDKQDCVKFHCPKCDKSIFRCEKCRDISIEYKCVCGFVGP